MGFDNECIPNIQSLAGEYFCPVCRLLVYPNEALQSQCTHLYCKPCLTYVVSTTRACPYDGYLVTEADSKPLIESNKKLAETIGKITVHCLYHRSGCLWQGTLSECTSHCSGCAFGNSPVVCNRCGTQIVHRQVQEHAQNCPGVQPQPQPAEGARDATSTGMPTTGNQGQAAIQTGTSTSQAQASTTSTPAKDTIQQISITTQAQTSVQAGVPTAEQWYQQQPQYQQYYQQYPGYDPYQQHYQQYYPYQQQAVSQYQQPQVSMHAQPPQPQPQVPINTLPQNLAQVNPQQLTHHTVQQQSLTQLPANPPAQGYPPPQAQSNTQPHPAQPLPQHVPQYQQPPSQMLHPQPQIQAQVNSQLHPQKNPVPQSHVQAQSQTPLPVLQPLAPQPNQTVNPNPQPQPQHYSAHAVTGHHSYLQPQIHQQVPLGAPQHPQGGPQPQSQQPVQMQSQFIQQPPLLPPPQSHATFQTPQQPGLLPSPVQVPSIPPAQQQPVHSHADQPGLPVQQRPVMQPIVQTMHQQYLQHQQPFPGQPWGAVHNQVHQQGLYVQQQHPQTQLHPRGPVQSFQQPSHAYPHPQQNVPLPRGAHPHQAQSLAVGTGLSPHGVLSVQSYPQSTAVMQARPVQIGANQQSGNILKTNNQVEFSSEQLSWVASRPISERQGDIEKGAEGESSAHKTIKKELNELDAGLGANASEMKTIKSESDLKQVDDENKPTGEAKDIPEAPAAANGEPSIKQVKDHKDFTDKQKDISNADQKKVELSLSEYMDGKDGLSLETAPSHFEEQSKKSQKDKTLTSQGFEGFPPNGHMQSQPVSVVNQGKLHPLPIHQGPAALQQRPVGPSLLQAPHGPPRHMQLPGHPPSHLAPGHMSSHYGPPQGPYTHAPTSQGERTSSYVHETSMFGNQRPNYPGGRQGILSNAVGMNGAQDPSSDRFRSFPDEHLNPFPHDPARRNVHQGEFEEDLKHFTAPSSLDTKPVPKSGCHFASSRPLDRGPHGFGVDGAPKHLDKGSHGLNYDSGLNMEPLGGSAPPRFFPPIHHDRTVHRCEAEGSLGFHDNLAGRTDFARTHPGFLGPPMPGYDHRDLDNLAPRSPGRDYPGMSMQRFGALPGLDDIDGRAPQRSGDPISSSLLDSRFPLFPSHLRRAHLQRGERLGPHNPRSHLRLGERGGFGSFPGHARMGELAGPGNLYHQQLGEPGFRSSFGGSYASDLQYSENSRKRKSSMGWCRICKVDCETVEGLDLHSQTREHQKMAMDMVVTIKQNVKKHKSAPSDPSSLEDTSKLRNASFEGQGNKH
ncbi:uncharacterized protein [Populus alba]|uniref:uncharacterized protein isoform X3 n=1 Tax=Populus alba TaxID=43335 RepID=UPI00158CAB40|nr:trithorax group protein osa-like isoform X3 [Populus alba]